MRDMLTFHIANSGKLQQFTFNLFCKMICFKMRQFYHCSNNENKSWVGIIAFQILTVSPCQFCKLFVIPIFQNTCRLMISTDLGHNYHSCCKCGSWLNISFCRALNNTSGNMLHMVPSNLLDEGGIFLY